LGVITVPAALKFMRVFALGYINKIEVNETFWTVSKVSPVGYWSLGVLNKDVKPLTITASLQYCNIPKPFDIKTLMQRSPGFDF
jgi:hypothetical protein